jgi:hypothetical protein
MCWFFLNICQNGNFEEFKFHRSLVFSCLQLLFPKKIEKQLLQIYYQHFSSMGPCVFLPEHLFCLSHCKTCRTMSKDNVGLKLCLLGTSNSMVTLIFFPWCEPKWSRDKLNNQSQILQGLGMTHGPCCKQPLSMQCSCETRLSLCGDGPSIQV